jgi:putative addiction module component (TIGR02574 family)
MSTEEILAQALRLPRAERARLAEEVLSSLEDPDEQVAAAWARELERRSNDIAEGRVQPVDWETAREQILKELEQRHAGRSSSWGSGRTHRLAFAVRYPTSLSASRNKLWPYNELNAEWRTARAASVRKPQRRGHLGCQTDRSGNRNMRREAVSGRVRNRCRR